LLRLCTKISKTLQIAGFSEGTLPLQRRVFIRGKYAVTVIYAGKIRKIHENIGIRNIDTIAIEIFFA
jgi:hypothetical protein